MNSSRCMIMWALFGLLWIGQGVHACSYPVIAIYDTPDFTGPGVPASLTAHCVSGGPISSWKWQSPFSVATSYPDYSTGTGSWSSPGYYYVYARGWNGYYYGYGYGSVWVLKMNQVITDPCVADASEVNPGLLLAVGDTATVKLRYLPANLADAGGSEKLLALDSASWTVKVYDGGTLIIYGSDKEQVWPLSPTREVTVEGYQVGIARLDLSYCRGGVTMGETDQINVTVVKVDIDALLTEEQEEDPGLYINANWDDDDGDGWEPNDTPPNGTYTGDKSDSYVYDPVKAPSGDNDLRPFWISIEPAGLSGSVQLTYSSGLTVWETATKRYPSGQSSLVASGTQFVAFILPVLLYVEGVSGSTTFKDRELRATYLPCGATDAVKVTVFEVDLTGFFGYGDQKSDNSVKMSTFGGSSDKDGMISWDDANGDGSKSAEDPNCKYFHNCMECQGTVKPTGVTTQVAFDFKRDKWSRAWWGKQQGGGMTWGSIPEEEFTPWHDDEPIESDEDKSPSGQNHIYQIDGAGMGWKTQPLGWPYCANIGDYRERVMISLGGAWYQCSDFYKWHSKVYLAPKNQTDFTRDSMSKQALGSGWIAVSTIP